jgi:hypothetical protein
MGGEGFRISDFGLRNADLKKAGSKLIRKLENWGISAFKN